MLYETGDVQRDYTAIRGTDFDLSFQLVPLDLTGCSAVMSIAGLADYAMAVQPTWFGPFAQGGLALHIPAATVAAWPPGLYDYAVRVTFADATVRRFGHGKVWVS